MDADCRTIRGRSKAAGLLVRLAPALAALLVLAAPLQAAAVPRFCEELAGVSPELRQNLQDDLRDARSTVEIGLLNGAGVVLDADPGAAYQLEFSAGVTYALTTDLDRICRRGLPPGLGWQVFVGTRNFGLLRAGAFARYYTRLNSSAIVPVFELGGGLETDFDAAAPFGRAGIGLGNQFLQGMLLSDVIVVDGEVSVALTANLRIDWMTVRMLL